MEYRLGNQYKLNSWLAVKTTDWLSFSGRLEGVVASEIEGVNPKLNPMMVTTADTNNSGGTFLNAGLGFNTYMPNGKLKGFRLGFEYTFTVYQKVNGIQLKQNHALMLGLQYAFH